MGRRIESSIYRIAAELSRVARVREAVRHSVPLAMAELQHILAGIELGRVLQVLTSLLEDLLAVYVCSALLGGAVGGAIGAFAAAGVGAVPGAVGGASLGMSLATWVLGWLGLGLMAKEIADSLPAAFKEYAEGALEAWGPPNQPAYASHHEPFAPRGNVARAAMQMARGHRLLMLALLSGIVLYFSRGAAARLELLSKIRSSQRLGAGVADWLEANERKLMEHPALRHGTSGAQGGGAAAEGGAPNVESFEQVARGEQWGKLGDPGRRTGNTASELTFGEYKATFGSSTSTDYKGTFFEANPSLDGTVVVHHAVEQQVLNRYPGVVNESEMHSLENLRGIPKEINSDVHLSAIRKEWNQFYRNTQNPTQQQLLDKATEIDMKFGSNFNPPVGPQ